MGAGVFLGVLMAIGIVSIWTPLMNPGIASSVASPGRISDCCPLPAHTLAPWRSGSGARSTIDRVAAPFIGGICLFFMSYGGIVISLWPMIVPYRFTLWGGRGGAPRTQAFLLVGTLVLLPVILMYSGWSYWVFRGKIRTDAGYH